MKFAASAEPKAREREVEAWKGGNSRERRRLASTKRFAATLCTKFIINRPVGSSPNIFFSASYYIDGADCTARERTDFSSRMIRFARATIATLSSFNRASRLEEYMCNIGKHVELFIRILLRKFPDLPGIFLRNFR